MTSSLRTPAPAPRGAAAPAGTHLTEHTVTIDAAPDTVFGLIADVTRWPYIFSPTVHVEREELDPEHERLRIWAFANGQVRSWTSRRTVQRRRRRITFRQEVSARPVRSMGGEWLIEALPNGSTRVVLLHEFQAVDDDPQAVALIEQATDRNSTAELAALKRAAELGDRLDTLVLSFTDTVPVAGNPAAVYEFLYRAQDWPRRLPHVARLVLEEPEPNLQRMEMDTRAADGSVHTTHSVRVCFPDRSIVYKQTRTPEIMLAHVGRWSVRPARAGAEVVSAHTVMINSDKIIDVLGADGSVEQARTLIREALGRNSRTTMERAKAAAEGRD